MTESEVQQAVRLLTAQAGWRVWRNNKGAGKLENGSFIRWGLCNDNAQIGSHMRSADLIGIRPVVIGPEHVGMTLGQFVSIECKRTDWRPSVASEHETAQRRWAELINSLGGYAAITNNPEKLP